MKVVALISGGKDSCYNLIKCKEASHEIICLANLYPPPQGPSELDSYMYQSVGSEGIELVAEALGIPLIRQHINRKPEILSESYEHNDDDEVEDLFDLLQRVKRQYPEIEAVSVGAINSNYQKKRVEHVCERLCLTPLCYLWEKEQLELFDSMISTGIKAIIIKVASLGLKTCHLGLSLEEVRETIIKLHNRYGSHICGEGGEYESFVLDCPLYSKKISVQDAQVVEVSKNQISPVAYLRLKQLTLVNK